MKARIWLFIGVWGLAMLGLNSCVPLETSRTVMVDNSQGKVYILRHRRLLALLTPEGAFPEDDLSLVVWPTNVIPTNRVSDIFIPSTARACSGEILTGSIHLEPQDKSAWVHVVPSAGYNWLQLDGKYPLSFSPGDRSPNTALEPTPTAP